jgi:hypothetical protein
VSRAIRLAVALAIPVLAACGTPTPTTISQKAPISGQGRVAAATVCGLYSAADAGTALGVPVQARAKTIRGDQCIDRGDSGSQLIVTMVGAADASSTLARDRKAARAATVGGLGDDAVWAPYLGELAVRRADRGLIIQIFSVKLAGSQARDSAETLARNILAKL